MGNEREELLNIFEFNGLPIKSKILLIELEVGCSLKLLLEGFERNKESQILDCWKVSLENCFGCTIDTEISYEHCCPFVYA